MARKRKEPETLENAYKIIKQLLQETAVQNDRLGRIGDRLDRLDDRIKKLIKAGNK